MGSDYILTPTGNFISETELYHHGIKGMKWGIRRYQNADGSLTPAGKKRYGSSADIHNMSTDDLRRTVNRMYNEQRYMELTRSSSAISKAASGIDRASKTATDINKAYKAIGGDKNPYSKVAGQGIEAASRASKLAKKIDSTSQTKKHAKETMEKLEKMSDSDLAREIDRLNLEQQYARLQASDIQRGKIRAADVLDTAGDIIAIGASSVALAVGIKKLMNK